MQIDIIRIDVKNAEEFFTGFYSESAVLQNAYKLRRVLDFRQAVPGDYLLVKAADRPLASLEITRTNSRRIWDERSLLIATGWADQQIQELIPQVIVELMAYLKENRESIVPVLPLFVEVKENQPWHEHLIQALKDSFYRPVADMTEFRLFTSALDMQNPPPAGFKLLPFINLPLNERFELIGSHDLFALPEIRNEQLYQDYIEAGEESELLWQELQVNDQTAGYLCTARFNLLTAPEALLVSYWISSDLSQQHKAAAIRLYAGHLLITCRDAGITSIKMTVPQADLPLWQQNGCSDGLYTGLNIYLEN